jgi:hypothetical protein
MIQFEQLNSAFRENELDLLDNCDELRIDDSESDISRSKNATAPPLTSLFLPRSKARVLKIRMKSSAHEEELKVSKQSSDISSPVLLNLAALLNEDKKSQLCMNSTPSVPSEAQSKGKSSKRMFEQT